MEFLPSEQPAGNWARDDRLLRSFALLDEASHFTESSYSTINLRDNVRQSLNAHPTANGSRLAPIPRQTSGVDRSRSGQRNTPVWVALTLVIGVLTIGASLPLRGQEALGNEADETVFIETTNVRVVNVDVYATTRDGSPVTDLEAEDFHLEEDGRPVALTNFYKVVDGIPVNQFIETPTGTQSENVPAIPESPGPPTGQPPAQQPEVPETQRLWLVVYLDNHNMNPIHRTRVLAQLNEFIDASVRGGDYGMLVSYNQTLKVHQPFTDNSSALIRAVGDLEKASGRPTSFARERIDLLRDIEEAEVQGVLAGRIRQYAQSVEVDLRFTLESMTDMVRSLAGLPGRKAMLHVSDGMPMTPGKDLYYALRNRFQDAPAFAGASEFDMTRRLRHLEQLANSNRVSFFTLDATGLQMPSGFSAENRGGTFANDMRSSVDSLHQGNYQDSIRRIAVRTGGVPILNTNNAAPALRKVSKSLRSYYSLGYAPLQQEDGRYHHIELKVDRPGVQIRYREGYRSKDTATLVGESLQAGMRYGIQTNPLAVRVEIGEPEPYADGYLLLPMTLRIPIGKLLLVPQGAKYRAQVDLFFSALSDEGKAADLVRDTINLEIPPEDLQVAQNQIYRFDTKLQIKPGPQRVGIAVRDILADKTSKIVYPLH